MLDQILKELTNQISSNELLAGGMVLGGLNLLIRWLRPHLVSLYQLCFNRVFIQVDINDEMKQYKWITSWLSEHKYMKKARRVAYDRGLKRGDIPRLVPAPGWHLLWDKWRPLFLYRGEDKLEQAGGRNSTSLRHYYDLTVMGRRKYFESLMTQMKEQYETATADDTCVYLADSYGDYKKSTEIVPRTLDSVLLPPTIKDVIVEDLEQFYKDEDWYKGLQIPWRRGYLLGGLPGTGKTSFIKALASHFNVDLYVIPLKQISEQYLQSAFDQAEGFIVLEDIDCVTKGRAVEGTTNFSTLLNVIDGAATQNGQVLFMTSNHTEVLDPALIRPGRIDIVKMFGTAQQPEIATLYQRFFKKAKNADEFGRRMSRYNVTMAEVQGYLLTHRNSSIDAFRNIEDIERLRTDVQIDKLDVLSGPKDHV